MVQRVLRTRARPDFPLIEEALKKTGLPVVLTPQGYRIAASQLEIAEHRLLTLSNKDFSAWLATAHPEPVSMAQVHEDEAIRELERELAESADGIPASWHSEEAKWLNEQIRSKLASLSMREI